MSEVEMSSILLPRALYTLFKELAQNNPKIPTIITYTPVF